ncbi:2-phosphosulfolactate phosphatase [Rhodococcus sp. NPDC058521]|uniref:2-phosphosulfolactate phosphatase n=1 Tax=Rhodococcus sp. NPDC058521 TaxID=3346536 RepID=UPI00365849F1
MNRLHRQLDNRVRFDWGLQGAEALGAADIAVVVDVLSFTTTVTVAADAGITVYPYRWNDDGAVRFAADHDAVLARRRSECRPGQISLSPGSIRSTATPGRLVLPSPNGSTIAHHLAGAANVCVGVSLRNASAAATWIAENHDPAITTVAVVAAGERWPDGSLRPSVEDLWGAGAALSHLIEHGWIDLSPEARTAVASWRECAGAPLSALTECASGRELIGVGYGQDVTIAAEVDRSTSVPILRGNCFVTL